MKIKFKSLQEQKDVGDEWGLDESLIPFVHVLISANNDYTLCGQATDEYLFDVLKDSSKVTCKKCKQFLLDCKKEKLASKR